MNDKVGALTIHGARGSIPTSGATMLRHGGHTTCFSIRLADDQILLIDCGTGLLSDDLLVSVPTQFHVFLTHYHLDHVLGLQCFRPLFEAGHTFTFHGSAPDEAMLAQAVAASFAGGLFPVEFDATPSAKRFVALKRDPVVVGDGLTVTPFPLHHPQGCTGYRLDHNGRSVVIATDHEVGDSSFDEGLVQAALGADVLIHDAQYTRDEYDDHQGWGHSTWEGALRIATRAHVKRLVLTSHHPFRTDDEVDAIVTTAADHFPAVTAAHEGMTIPL